MVCFVLTSMTLIPTLLVGIEAVHAGTVVMSVWNSLCVIEK